jgi:hypothetical protein
MTRASVIEGPFCKGWGQKAGIKEIVKFGPLILVDMDGETFLWLFLLILIVLKNVLTPFFNEYGSENSFLLPPDRQIFWKK